MKRFLLIAAILLGAQYVCPAQSVFTAAKVEISKDKVRKGGRIFYAHFVEEHQTLYSIAKAYGVTTRDIIDSNLQLKLDENPIHPGNLLLIPIKEEEPKAVEEVQEPASAEPAVQQPQEKKGGLLDIFKKKDKPEEQPVEVPAPKPEALFPAHTDTLKLEAPDTFEAIRDSVIVEGSEMDDMADPFADFLTPSDEFILDIPQTINVTLMLPLNAADTPSERYFNFYMGALLAARNLGSEGLSIDLETLDTMDPSLIQEASFRLQDSDVIIGPVSSADIKEILPFLPEGKFLVSPMDAKTISYTEENNVILAATPTTTQIQDVVEWIKGGLEEPDGVLLINEAGKSNSAVRLIHEELDINNIPASRSVSYEISKGLEMDDWFTNNIPTETTTRVIVASDNEAFLKESIRAVNVQKFKGKNIQLYGPAKIRAAEMEDLCNANLHVSASYYIDYKEAAVQQFILDYRALFHTDPDSFAFHGYDTMMYFTSICAKYGRRWPEKLSEYRQSGLQTNFKFDESDAAGYVNSGIRRVIYSPEFKAEILR